MCGIASLINKAYARRTSPLGELTPVMLVVHARIKDIIYSIEIPPYKAVERGCKVDNIIYNLVCSWFLVDIKNLDSINSKP